MGCLTLLGVIGLLIFGVRMSPVTAPPTAIAVTVPPPLQMTPTPTPSGGMVSASFGAEGANPMDLLTAAQTINQRIDLLGIEGAQVVVSENADNPRLIIQLPPVDDPMRIFNLLTAPGYLELVDLSPSNNPAALEGKRIWTTGQRERAGDGPPPLGMALQPGTLAPFDTVIDGYLVLEAETLEDTATGQWIVQLYFDGSGAQRLETFTSEHVGDALGIVIDGTVISTPIIQSAIPGGTAVVQGNFSESEARELSVQLGSGPLRIDLRMLEMF